MPDFLQRDQAPLTGDQWTALDQAVVQTAQAMLVGRRFLELVGPFGPGVEALPHDTLMGTARGQIDLFGNVDGDAIGIAARHYLPLPLIYKDFWVLGRDLETSRQFGLPLDTSKAAAAAAACAQAEDHLLVAGDLSLELPGLRTVEGHQTQAMSDWEQEGRAFADVVATYSPIWQFNYMAVPRDYHSNTLRSEGDCLASGYPIQRSQVFEN